MYASKSFCNVGQFMSNVPGINSPIGEITPDGLTFSREVGIYEDPTIAGYTLYNFKSATDGVGGGPIVVPGSLVSKSIAFMRFLVNTITAAPGQVYVDELLQTLVTYGAQHGISQITLGAIVQHDQRWCPDWVKFKMDALALTAGGPVVDNENTIWLSSAAFETQYSEYQIVVVPPIDNLDLFFGTGASVVNMINAISFPQIIDRMNVFRGGHPETTYRSDEYEYIFPLNSTIRKNVNWPVLIYGPAGNNIDAIKDALIEYILAHSSYDRAAWTQIFPDIFKRTEFIIAPVWQNYAIANRTQAAGVYSPIGLLTEMATYIKRVAPAYAATHVDANACLLGHPYRSLNLMAIGGIDNRDAKYRISQIFPDYINVSTTSIEFNRMAPQTQLWALALAEMIILAETMNKYTTLPQGYMKVTRDGILYIVKTIGKIQYLIATKRSVYDLLGLVYD